MNYIYRRATIQDLPIALGPSLILYNLWGEIAWQPGRGPATFDEQRAAISSGLYIRNSSERPYLIPVDERLENEDLNPVSTIEFIHDRLRTLSLQVEFPINFPDIVETLADKLQQLSEQYIYEMMLYCYLNAHPSNSLLNSIHCSVIINHICLTNGITKAESRSAMCAALTMNWPILTLQDTLNSNKRAPTPSERTNIHKHPQLSFEFLVKAGVSDSTWLTLVHQHHEEPSSKGYPNHLGAADIHDLSNALRLTDRYVALITSRLNRPALTSADALVQLSEERAGFKENHLIALKSIIKPVAPGQPLTDNKSQLYWMLKPISDHAIEVFNMDAELILINSNAVVETSIKSTPYPPNTFVMIREYLRNITNA